MYSYSYFFFFIISNTEVFKKGPGKSRKQFRLTEARKLQKVVTCLFPKYMRIISTKINYWFGICFNWLMKLLFL